MIFTHTGIHIQTWVSKFGKTRNQIDYILVKKLIKDGTQTFEI